MKAPCILLTGILALMFSSASYGQIRKESEKKHRSLYISIGAAAVPGRQSNIHIEQKKYGNSYDLLKVPSDNQVFAKPGFPLGATWHIGYFFDCNQTTGFELTFNPIRFHIADSNNVHLKGKLDNANFDQTQVFSTAQKNYYYLQGGLPAINFIKRFPVMHPRLNRVCFDVVLKAGGGPALSHTYTSLDGNVFEDKLKVSGWNAEAEAAFRTTHWKYVFFELAVKYDYASFSGISIYNGTATQTLSTVMLLGSVGFTFPLNKDTKVLYYNYGPDPIE